jgi:uncharacterized membrane protein YfcA
MIDLEPTWTGPILLFLAGLAAGILNVLAGGGSFLTLPVLIFLGLPATVANGTNRVGILLQNVAATGSFHRKKVLDYRFTLRMALPALVGAAAGTLVALQTGETGFKRILATLMIVITLWTVWDPVGRRSAKQDGPGSRGFLAVGFFLVGIYGGFVQAGVGFLILALTTVAGFDLVRGNAIKVLLILIFTTVSLGIFAWNGKVAWIPGLALAAGTILGGLAGAKLTVLKGNAFIRGVVTVAVILMAIRLWATS